MTTYPSPSDPVSALTRADGTTKAHSDDHGRVIDIWENAKANGAVGNATTNEYAAVQALLDGLAASGNDNPGRLYFPKGQYKNATASWVVPPGVRIEGHGLDTIFINNVPGSDPLFRVDGPVNVGHTVFKNFKINGGNAVAHSGTSGTGLGHGIHLNGSSGAGILHTRISDVTFDGVGDATHWCVYATWALETYIDHCDVIHAGGGGFYLGDTCNASSVRDSKLSNNGDGALGGIYIDSSGTLVEGNVIESFRGSYGIYVGPNSGDYQLVRNHHEDNSGKNIWVDGSTGQGVDKGTIIGCNVDRRGSGYALYAESVNGLSVISSGLGPSLLKSTNSASLDCQVSFRDTFISSLDVTGLVHPDDRYMIQDGGRFAAGGTGVDGLYLYKGGNVSLDAGYIQVGESTAPSTPAANFMRSYVADDDGVTRLRYITADGVDWRVRGERAPAVLTDAASVTVNAAAGNILTVNLTAARTFAAPTNPTDGQALTFLIYQNSGAPITPLWNAIYHLDATSFDVANNKRRTISFVYYKGAGVWYETGRSGDMSP